MKSTPAVSANAKKFVINGSREYLRLSQAINRTPISKIQTDLEIELQYPEILKAKYPLVVIVPSSQGIELRDEIKGNQKLEKDIDLLISQSERCSQILKKLSLNPDVEDNFIGTEITFKDYLTEIIRSFEEISEKKFFFETENNKNLIKFQRSIEINYGLRNFIGNANKFSKESILIKLISNEKSTEIHIIDDGPGFPNDIIDKLGEPYIRSSLQDNKSKIGLGLGTFIGKTLIEKNYGKVYFKNISEKKGAFVNIKWLNADLERI